MKKIYNKFLSTLEALIVNMHVIKMFLAENYALFRKRKLYNQVRWNISQKKEFDEFWEINYGKKIKTNGHKLYESINGKFYKEYFPDFLFSTKLEPKLNNYIYAKIYSDKSLTELLYSKSLLIELPTTYLIKSGGVWYNNERAVIDDLKAKDIMFNMGKAIIKPTIGGNSGKGICFSDFKDGADLNNETSISELLKSSNTDLIIQEKMEQHSTFSTLYPYSINTIRIITYIAKGKTFHTSLSLRIGLGGNKVDNIHAGGICVGMTDNGKLFKEAYLLGYSDIKSKLEYHPDTKVKFHNYKIEGTLEIINAAKELHGYTPHIGIISWDFMISKKVKPILIEANYMGQSLWFPQIVNKQPIFKENTAYMINKIKC